MCSLFVLVLWLIVVAMVVLSLAECSGYSNWPAQMIALEPWRQCSTQYDQLVYYNYDKIGLTLFYLYLAILLWYSFVAAPPVSVPRHRYSAMVPSSLLHRYRHLRIARTRLSRLPRHYHLHRRYKRRHYSRPPHQLSPSETIQSFRHSRQHRHHRHQICHISSKFPKTHRFVYFSTVSNLLGQFSVFRQFAKNFTFHQTSSSPPIAKAPHHILPPYSAQALTSLCQRVDFLKIHRLTSFSCTSTTSHNLVDSISQELVRFHHLLYTCESSISISPSQVFLSHGTKQSSLPTVIDSGASMSLSPLRSDFVTFKECSTTISGVSAKAQVQGTGTVRWRIADQHGVPCIIETEAYYVPEAGIRLYSPQHHFREHSSGCLFLMHNECVLRVPHSSQNLSFPYQPLSQLPLMLQAPSEAEPQTAMMIEDDLCGLSDILDSPPYPPTSHHPVYHSRPNLASVDSTLLPDFTRDQVLAALDSEQACFLELHTDNPNVSTAQLELLGWHYKLGHIGMQAIQRLMSHGKRPLDSSTTQATLCPPCVIETKYAKTPTCPVPRCASCLLGKMERVPKSQRSSSQGSGILRQSALQPGDCISIDQYEVSVPGRTVTSGNSSSPKYVGGTLFVDHMSGKIFTHHQLSLRANDTLMGKRILEREACQLGIKVSSFLSDNGVFRSAEFRRDLDCKNQSIRFSGVGAHHQNGIAERAIKTICYLARTMLIHSALCWPAANDLELWPFAFSHAVFIWNNLPGQDGLAPEEKWTGSRFPNFSLLRRLHPWGCPSYVLDPTLQDGKKLPKWQPRSRQGKYLGFSSEHASSVALVLNPQTKRISPQFHLLFDDYFTTVQGVTTLREPCLETFDWDSLYSRMGSDRYFDGDEVPPPPPDWPSSPSQPVKQPRPSPKLPSPLSTVERLEPTHQRENPSETPSNLEKSPLPLPDPPLSEGNQTPMVSKEPMRQSPPAEDFQTEIEADCHPDPSLGPSSEPEALETPPTPESRRSSRPRRLNKKYFNDDYINHTLANLIDKIDLKKWPQFYTYQASNASLRQKYTMADRLQEHLQGLDWGESIAALTISSTSRRAQKTFASMESLEDPHTRTLDEGHPLILAAKATDQDSPRWFEATTGEHKEGFWDAMWVEISTLLKMEAWEQVEREQVRKTVKTTWAFKKKRFPSGEVRKLKARFCVRGDTQTEGVDYFESFAPVVSWNTVRVLLVLTVVLGLKSTQVDYLAAFCQAPIDTEVYIDPPRGWERLNQMGLPITFKPGHVLRLKRSLYGLVQSPKNFFQHLKSNLIKTGFRQSDHDPCLFLSDTVICLVYVDDCLFFGKEQSHIDAAINRITETGMVLEVENDAAGFLGVNINRLEDGTIELTQPGLANKIVEALGMQDANPKSTPAPIEPLGRDINGAPFSQEFNYASIVGMLMYLCMHSRPDISFAVNQCARYTHHPTQKHATYLKRIGKYLKNTAEKGLVIRPSTEDKLGLTCYVDADFAGLWHREDEQDPHCVRSRGGWVITMASCPVIWKSKLLPLICLSTMESEYVALSTACRDLLPLHEEVKEIGKALGLPEETFMNLKTTIWEDNQAALKLANLELPYMTNRSKHIAIKYHWFRAFVGKLWTVEPIDTKEQLADIFTKGLPKDLFEHLRRKLMGW